jgi:hypothetical protein
MHGRPSQDELITHEDGNDEAWICLCGNKPHGDGFTPATRKAMRWNLPVAGRDSTSAFDVDGSSSRIPYPSSDSKVKEVAEKATHRSFNRVFASFGDERGATLRRLSFL